MRKKPSDDEIVYWRERREEGAPYRQIVDESFVKFGKRRSPETIRKHAADVEVEEDLEEEELPPGEPISEERKKEQMEIMKKFLEKKPLEEILGEHHYDLVFSVRNDYEGKVLRDNIKNWEDRLRFLGVWDENAEDPVQEGIWRLSDRAERANMELRDLKGRVEEEKNSLFRDYREKQQEDTETISSLRRDLREKNRALAKKDKEWCSHIERLKRGYEKNIVSLRQQVKDSFYCNVKYEEAMDFTKSADPLVEAYRKGQFNMITRLYELPLEVRRQFDTKLTRAVRSRDWKGFMDVVVDLIEKVDPNAEQWIKRESAVVTSSKNTARRELYQQLANLGFTGTLKDLKEVLEKNLSKPQLQRGVETLEARISMLRPQVEKLESNKKYLEYVISRLWKIEKDATAKIKNYTADLEAYIQLRTQYNISPRDMLLIHDTIKKGSQN